MKTPRFTIASLVLTACAMTAGASEVSCEGWFDGVRASKRIDLAPAERLAFVEYIRANHETLNLGWGAVHNDHFYDIILSNHGGTIAIFAETEADETRGFLRVKTCNATADWRPVWTRFLKLVRGFPGAQKR